MKFHGERDILGSVVDPVSTRASLKPILYCDGVVGTAGGGQRGGRVPMEGDE